MDTIKVILDGSSLGRRKTGNETYVRGLIRGFAGLHDDDIDVTVITTPHHRSARIDGVGWQEIPASNFVSRNLRTIPRLLAASDADLYHAIYWVRLGIDIPYVVTIHDLSFVAHPAGFKTHERIFFTEVIRRVAAKARRILTVSQFSKRELCDRWNVPPERIDVTYGGLEPIFVPQPDRAQTEAYVLYVGNLHARKNLVRLLEAFARVRREVPVKMTVAGQRAPGSGAVFDAVRRLGIEGQVEFTGYVDEAALVRLYQGATLTVLPSLYEGFGLPALEAMACGSPVVVSNTTALPEVVGDAGVLVDPTSVDAIADGMARVLRSSTLQAELRERGLTRARSFTWERTARETLAAYRAAVAAA